MIALVMLALPFQGVADAGVHPGLRPFGGFASTALRLNAHQAYLISFTVLREVTPKTSRVELISSIYLCDTDLESCAQVAEQTDPLPISALRVATNGRSATLRTRWAGVPLVVTWTSRGTLETGQALAVASADGLHHQSWVGGYTKWNDVTSTQLFGRSCRDTGGVLYASRIGAAEDYNISGPSGQPRADRFRARLAATRGRCFNPQP